MDVDPTPEHTMLRDVTRAFLESRMPMARVREMLSGPDRWDAELWKEAASLGWCGMLVPEQYGGVGRGSEGVVDAAVVSEELGRNFAPGPFLPVNVVADAISRTGSDDQREAILPSLVAGETVATWAVSEGPGCWDARGLGVTAVRQGAGYVVEGLKRWVQDARIAHHLLVTCRHDGGIVQLHIPLDTPGVTITPLVAADPGRDLADVEFKAVGVTADAVVGAADLTEAQVARQLRLANVLQCAESVGATASVVERTVAYAQDRIAFGRAIGSFQAVKHLLADAATWLEAAQAATWSAVHALADDRPDLARAVHVAKAFVARHCPRIVENCMQVHGGIAMTWDDDCHLYLRRVRTNAVLFASAQWHADRLCDLLGMAA